MKFFGPVRLMSLLVALLVPVSTSRAGLLTFASDSSWRAIGPVGNLVGQPFSVGAEWEQKNAGWNSLLDYDDSSNNGWNSAVRVDPTNRPIRIWPDGDANNGSTPAYFRKEFHIPGRPNAGLIDLIVDDDADVYVNGTLVFSDRDTLASFAKLDIGQTLKSGFNLLAVKAHDAQGSEGLEAVAEITFTPFPDPGASNAWSLSADFSVADNPSAAWSYGSKVSLGSELVPFTDTASAAAYYNSSQLAGWSDASLGPFPYVLKNVSEQDWVFDGRGSGGGIAELSPQEVLLHPDDAGRFAAAQWTAPYDGLFALDGEFHRFEQIEGFSSEYAILINTLPLPGGKGVLSGFEGPSSTARFFAGMVYLNTGDTIEFAVGSGPDGVPSEDGTVVAASILSVLTAQELAGQNLSGASFTGASLIGVDLGGAILFDADFKEANLAAASLNDAILTGADFTDSVVAGAYFAGATSNGFTREQLYSTASYKAKALPGVQLWQNDLTAWNFAGQDLRGASFAGSTLADADLTGAEVRGVDFWRARGFVQEQLYSTASYRKKELSGVGFTGLNLSGWDLSGQNLAGAVFTGATISRTNLDFADLRGAIDVRLEQISNRRNTILPDGSMDSLNLASEERLVVRDYDLPVTVNGSMTFGDSSTLELVFPDATWGSTINLGKGVAPDLGGTLALRIADEAVTSDLVGTTFELFRWNSQLPEGERFDQVISDPSLIWDTGELYTMGHVQLLNVIELQAGDADRDGDFDQLDLVQVQIAAKYLTGNAATWGEGDWNGALGGIPGKSFQGDGLFNQLDVVAAQLADAYLTGPYRSVLPDGQTGDGQTSIVYDANTGEVAVDMPAGAEMTSINIDSATGIFTGDSAAQLGGSFDNDSDTNIFKATFGGSFGSLSFGNVAQPGLSRQFVLGDLYVIGSLASGGGLGNVDLIYVPEPSSVAMLALGVLVVVAGRHSDRLRLRAEERMLMTNACGPRERVCGRNNR